jgi:hypothetical protein
MVHATSITATTGVLSMLADSAVTHAHVTPHTSRLLQSCYLRTWFKSVSSADAAFRDHLPFLLFADRFNNNELLTTPTNTTPAIKLLIRVANALIIV